MEKLVIFSAPSGSGKTTVVNHLLKTLQDRLAFSISATTRKKRPQEVDGKDYYFLDEATFRKKLESREFLEYEEVYKGLFYGTLNSEIERIWSLGKAVIFDVDVKGGISIKDKFGDKALSVFLRPPSVEVLMERLKKRDTEVEHMLKERVDKANFELQYERFFDIVIVNEILEDTLKKAEEVVLGFLDS
ncbi:MAG: guanylate kinase [Flavobacteriales bacterium]|nr:guanylate kinase [Flavobacteriales bacterium]